MKGHKSIVFAVIACFLLLESITLARHQTGELSGIHGIPVEGHDIVAGVEIVGTKHFREPGFQKMRERFRSNGADLKPGLPLEGQTLCRFKEILRDVLAEKGYLDAEVTHDTRPTYGNPRHLTLRFTITEGKRSRRTDRAAALLSPAQRCSK